MFLSRTAVLGVALLSFTCPNLARADDDCDEAEADIEDICVRMSPDPQGYSVGIRYKVEIEDAQPCQQFDLVLALRQNGCALVDESGREVTFVVPLVIPNDRCKDEFTFCSTLQNVIGSCNIPCPKDLKVAARVVNAQTGKVLDCEKEDVKFVGCVPQQIVVEQPVPVTVRTVEPTPVVVERVVQPVVVRQVVRPAPVRVVRQRVYYPAPYTRQVSVRVNGNW